MYIYSNYEIAMVASRCISQKELTDMFWIIIGLSKHDKLLNIEFARKVFDKRYNYLTKTSKK